MPLTYQHELLDIYNSIIKSGVYPTSWKKAIVIPILKIRVPSNSSREWTCFCGADKITINNQQ